MTEHVHDYQYHIVHQGKKAFYWYAECECGDRLEKEEIENCLNEIERLRELEKACIRLYVGEIAKPAWREFVRRSPEGQRLIAIANRMDEK